LGGGLPAQVAKADPASTAVGVVSTPLHGVHDEQPDQASKRQEQGQQQQLFTQGLPLRSGTPETSAGGRARV